jgi:hypothetical protein
MGEAEPHLQKGFQTNSDPAGTADFTFKTASNIVPPKQQGKYFKASYTKGTWYWFVPGTVETTVASHTGSVLEKRWGKEK